MEKRNPSGLMEARFISIGIARPASEVYAFVSDPRNLPAWASGLAGSVERVGGEWRAASPLGQVRIQMAPQNDYGVLDHDVVLESGQRFHNPMRVMPNGSGSELVFVLFRHEGVNDQRLEEDAATVRRDLAMLKRSLEAKPQGA